MKKSAFPTFLLIGFVSLFTASAFATPLSITVNNKVPNAKKCTAETHSLSLFYGKDNQQKPLAYGGSFTLPPTSKTFGKYMFGVQDNGWYWREDPSTGQNPDNAGMQVFLDADCNATTAPSWGGKGDPDAQKLLTATGTKVSANTCEVTFTRKANPTICVTKNCCGPTVAGGSNICKKVGKAGCGSK